MQKIVLIIPCFNEEKRIPSATLIETLDAIPTLYLMFVDDGSSDGTINMLEKIRDEQSERVEILCLGQNMGKAEAVRQGMLKAIETGCDYTGYWDADMATPLPVVEEFMEIMESRRADIVIGSRVRLLGRCVERNALRHYLGRVFATFASILLNIPVYDTQCGAKLFRQNETLISALGEPFDNNWIFDVELLARMLLHNLEDCDGALAERIIEHPLEQWLDVEGSKIRPWHYFTAAIGLGHLLLKYGLKLR